MNEGILKRREEYLSYIEGFSILDDDFMRIILDDIDASELVLRIILDKPDLIVTEVSSQYEVFNIDRHSVRLDVKAVDSTGNHYDIEVQRAKAGAAPKRARYNSSLIDADSLKKGEGYDKLPESYVIFITETDVLSGNKPLYHIDRIVRETGEEFDDKAHIIYVNNEIQDDTPLGRLMSDFASTSADSMYYNELAKRVRHYKETEEGVSNMCEAMEKLRAEGRAEGMLDALIGLVKDGILTLSEAAKRVDMPVSEFAAKAGLVV